MTRCLTVVACCLLALPSTAQQLKAEFGPRVTLDAEAIPLRQALEQIGRQLNRRFYGQPLNDKDLAAKPVAFHLRNATMRQAVDAVEAATGLPVARYYGGYYNVGADSQYPRRIGVPLGDWTVWLSSIRYFYNSYLYFGEPGYRGIDERLGLVFAIEAPSDADSVRLLAISRPTAVTAAGDQLALATTYSPGWDFDNRDPSTYYATDYLKAPALDCAELEEVAVDLTFAARVEELRFVFDTLTVGKPLLLVSGDYDAELTVTPGVRGGILSVRGPVPEGFDTPQGYARLRSERWLQARLYDAAGRALYTDLRMDTTTVKDGQWISGWRLETAFTDAGRAAAKLDARLYVPHGTTPPLRVAFSHLGLPLRDPEAATR
ncbi:MAG: hypothetical protein HYU66_24430 [Armatimonadetes bacterium]|nr:hypothetical protein [Armatimonadota bacterium]